MLGTSGGATGRRRAWGDEQRATVDAGDENRGDPLRGHGWRCNGPRRTPILSLVFNHLVTFSLRVIRFVR